MAKAQATTVPQSWPTTCARSDSPDAAISRAMSRVNSASGTRRHSPGGQTQVISDACLVLLNAKAGLRQSRAPVRHVPESGKPHSSNTSGVAELGPVLYNMWKLEAGPPGHDPAYGQINSNMRVSILTGTGAYCVRPGSATCRAGPPRRTRRGVGSARHAGRRRPCI